MSGPLVATVIASNYLPHLRVLEASLHRWHPDARLVALIADAAGAAGAAGVAGVVLLSPHALTPLDERQGAWPEEELLRSGTYSGGFVGIGPQAGPFIDWIADRTARDCVRSPERGLLYGQTWLNLVPALFAHRVLR